MPVITPAYPSMCATHNITKSTKDTILRELKRGGDLVDNIFSKKLTWKDLFERHTFFTNDFKYYLSVVSCSRTKEAQLLWSGLVESKVRHLVTDLEHDELISCARPFIEGFERVHRCSNEEEIGAVMRGDLSYQAKDIKTETTEATNDPKHNATAEGEAADVDMTNGAPETEANGTGYNTIHSTTYYIGLQLSQRNFPPSTHVPSQTDWYTEAKKLDISWATNKYKDICTQWPSYDEDLNSLHIVHTRKYSLCYLSGRNRANRA